MTESNRSGLLSSRKKSHFVMQFFWLFLVLLINGCHQYEVVVDDLSQREANEILVLLRSQNIQVQKVEHASKKNVVYQVKVKKEQADDALRLLVENHYPKTHTAGLKDVFPPGSTGIIPTKSDELARITMAMQGEIEALLKLIPGITDARVVISSDSLADNPKMPLKKTASATVIFLPQTDAKEPPLSELEIKRLIASSVTGLGPEDVTVVQKTLEPAAYLNSKNQKSSISETHELTTKKTSSTFSPWYFMGLTAIALVIAAYAVLRLFLERRRA